jgi:hypothetical protein
MRLDRPLADEDFPADLGRRQSVNGKQYDFSFSSA